MNRPIWSASKGSCLYERTDRFQQLIDVINEMSEINYRNCALCRVMRGLAFGGLGAAIGGYGAILLGVDRQEAVYFALFGALALTAFIHRKQPDDPRD